MSRTGTTNRSGRDGPDERDCGKSGDGPPVGCMSQKSLRYASESENK